MKIQLWEVLNSASDSLKQKLWRTRADNSCGLVTNTFMVDWTHPEETVPKLGESNSSLWGMGGVAVISYFVSFSNQEVFPLMWRLVLLVAIINSKPRLEMTGPSQPLSTDSLHGTLQMMLISCSSLCLSFYLGQAWELVFPDGFSMNTTSSFST